MVAATAATIATCGEHPAELGGRGRWPGAAVDGVARAGVDQRGRAEQGQARDQAEAADVQGPGAAGDQARVVIEQPVLSSTVPASSSSAIALPAALDHAEQREAPPPWRRW